MSEIFCSKVISEIAPSARSIIANNLLRRGMTQNDVSKALGITQPAISQYKKGLRGLIAEKMYKNEDFMDYLNKLTDLVYNDKLDINMRTCEICKNAREMHVIKDEELKEFLCLIEMARGKRWK